MLAQVGSIPEFALAVVGNVLTLCTFIYFIMMTERRAKYLARTFFKLQLPTLMLLVAVFAGVLAANVNARVNGSARNFGWPAAAISVSPNSAMDVDGWALLLNLSTAFGLTVPLLAGCEAFFRRQRGLNFEPAPRLVGAAQFTGEAVELGDAAPAARRFARARPASATSIPSARAAPFRLPPFTFSAAFVLLLFVNLVLLKRAWVPWVVDRTYAQLERTLDASPVTTIAFLPKQNRFLAGYEDGCMAEWSISEGRYSMGRFLGHTAPIKSIVVSNRGDSVTSISADSEMRFWRVDTGAQILSFGPKTNVKVVAAQGLDDERLVVACADGNVRLYDSQGHLERTFIGQMGKLSWVGFTPDGDSLISANWSGLMQFWSYDNSATPADSQPVDLIYNTDDSVRLLGADAVVLKGETSELVQAYAVGGLTWVLTYAHRGKVALWNPVSGKMIRSVPDLLPSTTSVSCTSDGKTIVTTDDQNRSQEWRFEPDATLSSHAAEVRSVRNSPDKTQFLTASRDGTARVWDADTGRECAALAGNTAGLLMAAFSPDGTRVITAAEDGSVRVFDPGARVEVAALKGDGEETRSADISADGARVLFLHRDGTVRICATDPPRELGMLQAIAGESEVSVARFEPAGQRILTGRRNATMQLWKNVLQWPSGLFGLWQFSAAGCAALAAVACFGVEYKRWRARRTAAPVQTIQN